VGAGVVGLLLAAGAGRRMGGPKALLRGADGTPWVVRAARDLHAAGCDPVRVVVGAAAADVSGLLADDAAGPVDVVVAADWSQGMGASLRAGLGGLAGLAPDALAAMVHLVDLPDVGVDVLARVASHASPAVLARACYGGRPGHPVLLGREHWVAIAVAARGDAGARGYLAGRDVLAVDCGDLASGIDVDSR
jgi:CTP:molybdopterin cytidylyltransferase MocA